jgi:hypothetical protein
VFHCVNHQKQSGHPRVNRDPFKPIRAKKMQRA